MTVVPLMKLDLGAAHVTYRCKDNGKVPGVTTVLGVLAKPMLLNWYAMQEREGILGIMGDDDFTPSVSHYADGGIPLWSAGDLAMVLPRYKTSGKPQPFAEVKRDKAADTGTVTHARIEAWLKGTSLDPDGIPPEVYAQSVYGLDRFMAFWDHERLSLLHSERIMVSEVHRVGGTGDVFAMAGDSRIYLDIKTNAFNQSWPYAEHIAQASAYAMMAEELDEVAIDQVWLVRVGKDPEDRTQVVKLTTSQRECGVRLFHGALACYNAKRGLD